MSISMSSFYLHEAYTMQATTSRHSHEPLTILTLPHRIFEYNFPVEDIGRGELGNTFAVLGNTTPTAWWFLYHLFSDSEVLSDVRSELETFVQIDAKTNTHRIDPACIRTSCPILLSTFQETLRFRAVNAGPRMVMEDVVIDGFLLKKGNVLMIPASVHHTDVPTWGESVMTFDHMRFARKCAPGKKKSWLLAPCWRFSMILNLSVVSGISRNATTLQLRPACLFPTMTSPLNSTLVTQRDSGA
jgi:hypothetical protein